MRKIHNNIFMSPAGENEGGSGGTGSLLTTPTEGGGAPAGAAPNSAAPGAAANAGGAGNAGAPAAGQPPTATDWRSSLPPEIQEDVTIKKFSDVSSLARSYLSAQKLIGRDKIPVPSKDSSDEEWTEVFRKLGLPEEESKYDVKFKEGVSVDKEFAEEFKKNAYKMGVLPKQAQALADWFSDVNLQAETKIASERKLQVEKEISSLKTEWGAAFDQNLSRAQQVLSKFADDETKAYLDKSGLGNDTKLIKFLANMGEKLYAEGRIVGADNQDVVTPNIAKQKLDAIYKDMNHPYFSRTHARHGEAVKEVQELLKLAGKTK